MINTHIVKGVTNSDANARKGIPNEVLDIAGIPPLSQEDYFLAKLLNPNGVEVDYFVSHFWGQLFERTVRALSNFAGRVYKAVGKKSLDA